MSHSIVQTLHVDTPAMPRGALLVGMIHSALISLFRVSPARQPTRTEEAASVREMAHRLQATDPGFAADLMVAADRHELLDETASGR
jgi:hypothetical protein